jgi:monoamine oxidase
LARTPLMQSVEDAVAAVAAEQNKSFEGSTRRGFLKKAGAAGIGVTALGRLAPPARAATAPKIVIVGAGLAGLTCAYRLQRAGYVADVYEASTRIGGRCFSGRAGASDNPFAQSQVFEHGGELIDQSHNQVRNLAQELGLQLDNLLSGEVNGTETLGYFDGRPYSYTEMTNDIKVIWQQIHKDVSAASYPTLFDSYTQRGYDLDHMSIADWIRTYVPGGASSRLGQLLDVAYNIEYGAETKVQSALNMLYLLGYSGQGQFRVFGPSNEKYHVRGGNDQIASGMASRLTGAVKTGYELVAIKRTATGRYDLTFRNGLATTTVTADKAVLALPFSILRSVNYQKAGFEPLKDTAIRELGMGTNSKLHVQFSKRHWVGLGSNGETYADTGYQNTWEVTRAQAGTAGILVDYTGGTIGASFGSGTATDRAKQFLAQIEPVLPGISQQWNGRAALDFWTGYPWTKGSYSYWKVGQYTKFSGMERKQQGNCHFCGEHTSIDFQGYLNGAVETGERVVAEIVKDLG